MGFQPLLAPPFGNGRIPTEHWCFRFAKKLHLICRLREDFQDTPPDRLSISGHWLLFIMDYLSTHVVWLRIVEFFRYEKSCFEATGQRTTSFWRDTRAADPCVATKRKPRANVKEMVAGNKGYRNWAFRCAPEGNCCPLRPNHLLALKLWNKKWREAMILASLLDVPDEVTEEQMDYWTKSLENTELAEMLSANLWVKTKFAYAKSLEWIVGKKYLVHYTGLHLMGRLAMTDKKAIDEMFEPYFEVLTPLAKDPQLKHVFYRSFLLIARRSENLHRQCTAFAESLGGSESESAREVGRMILEELAAR
jgi:hypothetical protein